MLVLSLCHTSLKITTGQLDEPAWLKCEENEEARRLFFNPEEPRICIFRAREEPQ